MAGSGKTRSKGGGGGATLARARAIRDGTLAAPKKTETTKANQISRFSRDKGPVGS